MINYTEKQSQSGKCNLLNNAHICYNVFSCEDIYGVKKIFSHLKSNVLFEISFVVSGSGIHRVLDRDIPCKAGDVCIIPPNIPHRYFLTDTKDNLTVRQILFDIYDWFDEEIAAHTSPRFCYGVFRDNSTIAYATLNDHMRDKVNSLYDSIESEILEQKNEWRELIRGYLANMLVNISRYVNSAIKNISFTSSNEWYMVSEAIRVINEEYSDCDLTLDYIAKNSISANHI